MDYIITPHFNVGINEFYQYYECRRHDTHPKTTYYTGAHWYTWIVPQSFAIYYAKASRIKKASDCKTALCTHCGGTFHPGLKSEVMMLVVPDGTEIVC